MLMNREKNIERSVLGSSYGFPGMKMLLGWGPMKSEEKKGKEKKSRLEHNV